MKSDAAMPQTTPLRPRPGIRAPIYVTVEEAVLILDRRFSATEVKASVDRFDSQWRRDGIGSAWLVGTDRKPRFHYRALAAACGVQSSRLQRQWDIWKLEHGHEQ